MKVTKMDIGPDVAWTDTPESRATARIGRRGAELFAELRSGWTYRYPDVPDDLWDGLRTAPSKGRFLQDHLFGRPGEEKCPGRRPDEISLEQAVELFRRKADR